MQLNKIVLFVLALLLAVPSSAVARRPNPHHVRTCRHGYHRVVQHRRVRQHWRRIVVCKKNKITKPVIPTRRAKLHAHLDPTYTRNPEHPLKVTYDFSASATQESTPTAGFAATVQSEEPTELPSGVLALYSDGKLECAINVGGGITSSACPVTYDELGPHTVTTVYTSGEQSATITEVENIGPYETSIYIAISYEPLLDPETGKPAPEEVKYEPGDRVGTGFRIGTVTIAPEPTPAGAIAGLRCPDVKGTQRLTESNCLVFEGQGGTYDVVKHSGGCDFENRGLKIDGIELEDQKLKEGAYSIDAEITDLPANYGYAFSKVVAPISIDTGGCVEVE